MVSRLHLAQLLQLRRYDSTAGCRASTAKPARQQRPIENMALSARDQLGQGGAYPAAAAGAVAAATAVSDSNSSSLSIDSELAVCEREISLVNENIQRVESALEDKVDFMGMRGNPDRDALLRCLDALEREKGRQREKEAQLREQRRQGLLLIPAPPSASSESPEIRLLLRTSNAPLRVGPTVRVALLLVE